MHIGLCKACNCKTTKLIYYMRSGSLEPTKNMVCESCFKKYIWPGANFNNERMIAVSLSLFKGNLVCHFYESIGFEPETMLDVEEILGENTLRKPLF